ncbi:MAG: cbb3-type cytochrome c oxidase subunit I [Bacteroidia bacterium]
MNSIYFRMIRFALILLILALCLGIVAAFIFFDIGTFNRYLPFYILRPLHVSSSIFWIFTAAQAGVIFYLREYFDLEKKDSRLLKIGAILWSVTIISILISYAFKQFGGREYWEFHPAFAIPILICWVCFAIHFFRIVFKIKGRIPVFIWMWSTGIIFFLFTYIEANLWLIPWFRENIIRDITVQWKANGAIVGSWNQIVYGTAIYLMWKISGNDKVAFRWSSFFFYFLGLTNLIFNWGHHTYNVPAASWVRNVSYFISMTEWILLINIMQSFRKKITEVKKFANITPYRFLLASEVWVFFNLILAILMSIPAVNIFTHGTHITVAHAMGTTIGINSMILLASVFYIFSKHNPALIEKNRGRINVVIWIGNVSLFVFWISLIIGGVIKGYQMVINKLPFEATMQHVRPYLYVFSFAGILVAASLIYFAGILLKIKRAKK